MCGVAAIFAYHYAAPGVDREELHKIRDHMTARGPDGKGEWFSTDQRVGLGHRRLSIIDLTDEAAQPMRSTDGKRVISFNGEIYNYRALRKSLEAKGRRFRTQSDTEVLLHLYEEKGEAMVHDLRGMFAFIIWDADRNALFMARDPYGIKPLYYADDGWTLRAASQVKALLAGGKVSRTPEPAGIVGFYLLGSVPEPWTTWQEIRALPAGHTLWVSDTGPAQPKPYFSIAQVWRDAEKQTLEKEEAQARIREALLDTVRHHMVADVPVGAFLSAGIDSSALVALMTEISQDHPLSLEGEAYTTNSLSLEGEGWGEGENKNAPFSHQSKSRGEGEPSQIKTITLAFEEFKGTENDESPLAEQIAKRYGTNHTTRYVTEQEFQHDLPKILEAMDQPTIDGINTWFVAKAAKEQGLKVAISGLGGDELFGGYPSFQDVPRWIRRLKLPSRIPLLGDAARIIGQALIPQTNINPKAAGMLKYGGKWTTAWYLRRGLFMPWELEQVMNPEQARAGLERLGLETMIEKAMHPEPDTDHGKVAALEASLYMRNQLLRDADWAGMAHSLEIRVPLVDTVLLRKLAVALNSAREYAKQPLADSPRRVLPVVITNRDKTGFSTPIAAWKRYEGRGVRRGGLSREWSKTVMEVFRKKGEGWSIVKCRS